MEKENSPRGREIKLRKNEMKLRKNEMKLRRNEMKLRRNFLTPTWKIKNVHEDIRERRESDKFPSKDM